MLPFLAKPQSWGAAPRFDLFPPKFTSVCAGPPSAPPAPKTCTVTQTYKSGSPAVSGEGRGRGWCCWAYPGTKIWKVETQGLARATQPTSRSEACQAGQANAFVGAYQLW